ncbi:MAG: LysR family transcriptional regulator [Myxococcota bacterium]
MKHIDRLLELLAIRDAGSITAAAARLGIRRSTLSRRLASLERDMGAQLLQRTSRGLRLTPAGQVLAAHSDRIAAEVEDARRAVRALNGAIAGPLRVATPPTELFEDLIVGFTLAYPDVQVWVESSPRHVDLLAENIDVALRFGTVQSEWLISRPIGTFVASLVASAAYVRTHGLPGDPSELAAHRCILGRWWRAPASPCCRAP